MVWSGNGGEGWQVKVLEWGRALVWPDRCALCGDPVAFGECCCPRCRRDTPLLRELRWLGDAPVAAVWAYRGRVPAAVGRFKFRGDRAAGRQMARLMAGTWQALCPDFGAEGIAFVPMPPERERQRGYNQARLLARWVGEELDLPVLELLRREGVLMQHQLPAGSRRRGIDRSYRLLPGAEEKAAGKRILLVDDVVTTGGTMGACAARLRQAGAEAVALLAVAAVE